MGRLSLSFLTLALASTACSAPARHDPVVASAPTPSATASAPPDPDAGRAPTPYTVDQLRKALVVGKQLTFVVEGPDKLPQQKRFRFVAADDEHVTVATELLGDDGKVLGQPEVEITTWDALRHHASYPVEATTISDATAEVPAGSFACKRYTVIERKDDAELRTVACFGLETPGPPLEMTVEKNGKLVLSMSLLRID